MGFVALAIVGAAAFGTMALLGVGRALWSLIGAALFLGAAGYAWQGRPLLVAAPAQPVRAAAAIDPAAIALRDTLLGRYTMDASYLVAADAMTRAGDTRAAARVTLAGVRKLPKSFILWTWAGVTLAADGGDQVTPPALLAFRQAARLAPEHPAPPFYAGLAYVRAGQFGAARAYWRRALALSPEGTSYRREIAVRLALLERLLASGAVR
jgi:cytochrome c-type biogenesis protein CcmH/NrfG